MPEDTIEFDQFFVAPTPGSIRGLLSQTGGIRVTLFMPLHRTPPESEKNPIVGRELIKIAEKELQDRGVADTKLWLEVFERLIAEPENLLRSAAGFAYLSDGSETFLFDLPYPVEKRVEVGGCYGCKGLLPILRENPNFAVLALSRGEVRFYEGSRIGLSEREIADLPGSLDEYTRFDDPEKSVQNHTAKLDSRTGAPGRDVEMVFHGQGDPDDPKKVRTEHFLNAVGKAVHNHCSKRSDPLVVFGNDENVGKLLANLPQHEYSVRTVRSDPGGKSDHELCMEAFKAIEPEIGEKSEGVLNDFEAAIGRGEAVLGLKDCLAASAMGRADQALVAMDQRFPGEFQAEGKEASQETDLLNRVAAETLAHGGEVHGVLRDEIAGGPVVVLPRYEIQ